MKPLQSQLWQFIGLPVWQCVHGERLPFAPTPEVISTDVLVVIGQGHRLPDILLDDLAIALNGIRPDVQDETGWLAAGRPGARLLLGMNLTMPAGDFAWQGTLPLSSAQKRELWSRLCSLNSAP